MDMHSRNSATGGGRPTDGVAHPTAWCGGSDQLVRLLGRQFGPEAVCVCSPYHIQIKRGSLRHNVWIDSGQSVKYRLADQAGGATVTRSSQQLLTALQSDDPQASDLAKLRQALELTEMVATARSALVRQRLSCGVFVDAGFKDGKGRISAVEVTVDDQGEHVRAQSHPIEVGSSTKAETQAIEFAVNWSDEKYTIFSDNQACVQMAQKTYGDRICWLPRSENRPADKLASMRGKTVPKKKKKRRRRSKQQNTASKGAKPK